MKNISEKIKKKIVRLKNLRSEYLQKEYLHADVPFCEKMSHSNWSNELVELANKHKLKVLEIGSREVCGPSKCRKVITEGSYVGFDYYPGANVDVVGDAHKLSSYFDEKFDLIFSSAVFEHLAMPWLVAEEISKLLNVGGYVFIETHYSFSSHERPWHFFQFSDMALKALFNPALGFECIEAGVSNPIIGKFSKFADKDLRNTKVTGLYCHSGFFGRKIKNVQNFNWKDVDLNVIVNNTKYVKPEKK